MAAEPCCPCWIVVVATDRYAGNFEREMCAYCTGVVGECGVGEELAAAFPHDRDKWRDRMLQFPDDHGCRRPASIWGGPKFNDVAMFFADRPSEQELDFIRSMAARFVEGREMALGPGSRVHIRGLKLLEWDGGRGREAVRQAAPEEPNLMYELEQEIVRITEKLDDDDCRHIGHFRRKQADALVDWFRKHREILRAPPKAPRPPGRRVRGSWGTPPAPGDGKSP